MPSRGGVTNSLSADTHTTLLLNISALYKRTHERETLSLTSFLIGPVDEEVHGADLGDLLLFSVQPQDLLTAALHRLVLHRYRRTVVTAESWKKKRRQAEICVKRGWGTGIRFIRTFNFSLISNPAIHRAGVTQMFSRYLRRLCVVILEWGNRERPRWHWTNTHRLAWDGRINTSPSSNRSHCHIPRYSRTSWEICSTTVTRRNMISLWP